jgi:23S rRNA (pseudouridine1915-N3)-methyltransferase
MRILCLTVGKKHDPQFASAIETYQQRLAPYVSFEFGYIPPSDTSRESAAILSRIKDEDSVMLLDETGTQLTNRQLAGVFENAQQQSVKRIVIIIGGAYGVDDSVLARSDIVLSLSKLVFPHQLVRLLLTEQLYRSFNLLAGGKYHHE